jgi:hypothetical protein
MVIIAATTPPPGPIAGLIDIEEEDVGIAELANAVER